MAVLSSAGPVVIWEIRIAEPYLKVLYLKKAVYLLRIAANHILESPACSLRIQGVLYEL